MLYDILIQPLGGGVYNISGLTEAGSSYLGTKAGKIGYVPLHHLAVRAMADGLTLKVHIEGDGPDVAFPGRGPDSSEVLA